MAEQEAPRARRSEGAHGVPSLGSPARPPSAATMNVHRLPKASGRPKPGTSQLRTRELQGRRAGPQTPGSLAPAVGSGGTAGSRGSAGTGGRGRTEASHVVPHRVRQDHHTALAFLQLLGGLHGHGHGTARAATCREGGRGQTRSGGSCMCTQVWACPHLLWRDPWWMSWVWGAGGSHFSLSIHTLLRLPSAQHCTTKASHRTQNPGGRWPGGQSEGVPHTLDRSWQGRAWRPLTTQQPLLSDQHAGESKGLLVVALEPLVHHLQEAKGSGQPGQHPVLGSQVRGGGGCRAHSPVCNIADDGGPGGCDLRGCSPASVWDPTLTLQT